MRGNWGYFITRQRPKHPKIECFQVITREFEQGRAEQLPWSAIPNVVLSRIEVGLSVFLLACEQLGHLSMGLEKQF